MSACGHEVCAILWAGAALPVLRAGSVLPFPAASPGMWEPAWLLRGLQGSRAGQAVPLPLLPPRGISCCLWPGLAPLCCPRSCLLFLLTDQDLLAVRGWLKVRVTLGGSGHSGAHRDFPDRERGAGTGKSHGWELDPCTSLSPSQACTTVLKRVGCRKREGQAVNVASWQPPPAWGLSACELNQKGSQQGDPGDKVTSEPSIRWLGAAPPPG